MIGGVEGWKETLLVVSLIIQRGGGRSGVVLGAIVRFCHFVGVVEGEWEGGFGLAEIRSDVVGRIIKRVAKGVDEQPEVKKDTEEVWKTKYLSKENFARGIVDGIVEGAVERVEIARVTQKVIQSIGRGGGDGIWNEAEKMGARIWEGDKRRAGWFGMLSYFCKRAAGSIRKLRNGGKVVKRDVRQKIEGLEGDWSMLKCMGEKGRKEFKVGFVIRRVVVQTVLNNLTAGMEDSGVFHQCLKVITELYKGYRKHCKVEVAVLCEHYILRVLRLGPQVGPGSLKNQQLAALEYIVRWFDTPHNVCELYLNYDLDQRAGVERWRVCEQVCAALCTLAEQCSEVILGQSSQRAAVQRYGNPTPETFDNLKNTELAARTMQEMALGGVQHVVRCLMDASGHVFMMGTDAGLRHKSISLSGGWEAGSGGKKRKKSKMGDRKRVIITEETERSSVEVGANGQATVVRPDRFDGIVSSESGKESISSASSQVSVDPKRAKALSIHGRTLSVAIRQEEGRKTEETLKKAFDIISKKGLKKGLTYLIAVNFLTPSPRDVSNFLRVQQGRLDSTMLGDYLGEGGTSDVEYWNLIRYHYIRAISFEGMNVEQGLRHFLTSAGFRLPGEAQKIDRLITVFAQCFWEDNAGTACCPFSHQDTVFILAFSVIMLNTDLHKANVDTGRKQRKKMTKAEFMNNLRGVDNSSDLSKDYLSGIYDSIASQVIEMSFDPQGRKREEEGDKSRVSYKGLSKGVKTAGELLRGMALFDHHYSLIGVDCMISNELISSTVEACFHHFHGIIAAILDAGEFDLQSVLATLDILKNSLCASVFLDMKMERQAFATQLARIKYIKEEQEGGSGGKDAGFYIVSGEHKKEEWFVGMERACETGHEIEKTIGNIHLLIVDLRASMHDSRKRKELKTVCSRIQGGDELLSDANREFILEGDLLKRCRSGKKVKYRFFLFSDRLIYTHLSIKGYYKIHEQVRRSEERKAGGAKRRPYTA